MILVSKTSSSDTKIEDDDNDDEIKDSKIRKIKILYLGIMCFTTNCLSSIALEAGSRSSLRSISPRRPAIFNNLFFRNYNLRIKIMVGDVLAALISTMMLAIGDTYGIPYLYLPWLINTIKGMVFHEGPALFELAYSILPKANLSTGLFMFITFLLYVEELCIWKDVFMNFERCWTKYNKNNKLRKNTKSIKMANKELCNEVKESLVENIVSQKSMTNQQASTTHFNESNNHDVSEPAVNNMKDDVIKNHRSKSLFTEVTG